LRRLELKCSFFVREADKDLPLLQKIVDYQTALVTMPYVQTAEACLYGGGDEQESFQISKLFEITSKVSAAGNR
jgi:hypothetical protein